MSKDSSDNMEIIAVKVSPALKKRFSKKCKEGSWSKAEILRTLIKEWTSPKKN